LGQYAVDDERDLRDRTIAAAEVSLRYPELAQQMSEILAASRELARSSVARVGEVLKKYGLALPADRDPA